MNKILPHVKGLMGDIKENLLFSSLTVAASLLIANKILFPVLKSRKNRGKTGQGLSLLSSNYLFYFQSKFKKSKNFQDCYLFISSLQKKSEDEEDESDAENINNNNSNDDKIKKTKKIIKKITNDYLKDDEKPKSTSPYENKKDKIFYLLLNNFHLVNEKNNNISTPVNIENIHIAAKTV